MSNTQYPHFLRCSTIAFMMVGMMLLVTGSSDLVMANVVGQGSTVIHPIVTESVASLRTAGIEVPVPMDGRASAELRLILGMLMVLAALGFHALSLLRVEDAPVPAKRRRRSRMGRFVEGIHRAFRTRLV